MSLHKRTFFIYQKKNHFSGGGSFPPTNKVSHGINLPIHNVQLFVFLKKKKNVQLFVRNISAQGIKAQA